MKQLCLKISVGVSFLIFLVLLGISNYMGNSLPEQQMAKRWSDKKDVAQVSCFFSVSAYITQDQIEEFEHSLDSVLKEASVEQESTNPGARLWIDAYSADGKVTIASERSSMEADAIGIGGEFFRFHPLKLLTGSYFSGNDLMQDYCVIDEDAAWQLFGSNDVAGQMVYIGGIPHIVTGVVERPGGRLKEAAGLSETVVYVSYQTLRDHGTDYGINHYEIVMPNPVSGFALKHVKEKLGSDEKNVEVLENTSRYSLLSRIKTIQAFGTRSMNGKAIIYPYWENVARGYEDIIALLTVFAFLFLLYPVIMVLTALIRWWKHKGWTIKEVWQKCRDKAERFVECQREQRKRRRRSEGDYE
ncbi:MAG: ABC transporter permease [Lachnospiraceae bacterium]|nr:ABC transporter permease [Lachnospiraceae bacterium]